MGFDLLGNNLREIYSAAHSKEKQPSLVADIFGNKVYHSATGWGKFWKWFYNAYEFVFRKDIRDTKLEKAMKKTHFIFNEKLSHIEESVKTFQTYLEAKGNDPIQRENSCQSARHEINQWNATTSAFTALTTTRKSKKLNRIVDKFFPPDSDSKKMKSTPFDVGEIGIEVQKYQNIIDIEGEFDAPLPWHLLEKLSVKDDMSSQEEQELRNWITTLNKKQRDIGVGRFHSALRTFIERLQNQKWRSCTPDIVTLELALIDWKCTIFSQADHKHIAWREQLSEGSEVECNQRTFVLGKKLGGEEERIGDHNIVFEIQGEPEVVLVIGLNKAILHLKNRLRTEDGWGIPSAIVDEVDLNGRCAIVERLVDPIMTHQWTSTSTDITSGDEDIVAPICHVIQWFLKHELTPTNFSPDYLMFDQKDLMKCTKICLPEEFNFTALEDFIITVSKGNPIVYKHIIEETKLQEYPYTKFYRTMLDAALQDKQKNASVVAALDFIIDPRIVDRGEDLFHQVIEMRKRCCQMISDNYVVSCPENVPIQVVYHINKQYCNTKSMGNLWHTIEQDVVNGVAKSLNLPRE